MAKKLVSEEEVRQELGIKKWGEFTPDIFEKFLNILPNIDNGVKLSILGQIPEVIKLTYNTISKVIEFAKPDEVDKKNLELLQSQLKNLEVLSQKESLSPDSLNKVLDVISQFGHHISEYNKRRYDFKDKVIKTIWGIGAFAIMVLAVAISAKGNDQIEINSQD